MASDIFQGMWWAVQTLTSLGYGDFPVQTVLGKLVRSFFFVLLFPVLIELFYSLSLSFPISFFFPLPFPGRLVHCSLWCACHGLADPHRGGQLRRLLLRAEEAGGEGVEGGGDGQGGGGHLGSCSAG